MTSGGSLFSTISFLPHKEPQPTSRPAERATPSRAMERPASSPDQSPARLVAPSGSTGSGMPPLKIGPPTGRARPTRHHACPVELAKPEANQLADYGVFLPVKG